MSATLLFHMFKNKTEYPLHSAVRLRREDVVFLYLVEHNSQVSFSRNVLILFDYLDGALAEYGSYRQAEYAMLEILCKIRAT